jgi:hypothetical protein
MNFVARMGHFVASALAFLAAFRVFRGEWPAGDGAVVYVVSGLFLAIGIHHLARSQRQSLPTARSFPPAPFPQAPFPQGPVDVGYGYPPPPPPPRWPGDPGF